MRILHVVQSLAIGGQEALILTLTRVLVRRGHDVAVVCLRPGGVLVPEFAPIPVTELARSEGFDPRLFVSLGRLLRRFGADAVHTHNTSPLVYGATVARALGIRALVHTKHGLGNSTSRTRMLARVASRFVSAYACVSEETARMAVAEEGAPPERVRVVQNGIDVALYSAAASSRERTRTELGIPLDARVVGTVGRLVKEKDQGGLVRAFKRLDDPGARLVLVGEGPERSLLEGLAQGDRRIVLAGARRDVPALLAAFDVFALSSRTEGVPLAVLEAMAAGLPVVATRVGGLAATVPLGAGALVAHGDEAALGDELRLRLDDKARCGSEGAVGRAHAHARFSVETMTDTYEAMYSGAAPGPVRSGG